MEHSFWTFDGTGCEWRMLFCLSLNCTKKNNFLNPPESFKHARETSLVASLNKCHRNRHSKEYLDNSNMFMLSFVGSLWVELLILKQSVPLADFFHATAFRFRIGSTVEIPQRQWAIPCGNTQAHLAHQTHDRSSLLSPQADHCDQQRKHVRRISPHPGWYGLGKGLGREMLDWMKEG